MNYRMSALFLCLPFIAQAKVLHVQGSKQLKEKIDQQPTVIKFSATWCGPCQMAKTPFKEISNMPEFSHITFVGIDTDQQQSLANAYNVTALPTFVFIRSGAVVEKIEGLIGANSVSGFKQNLARKLNRLFTQQRAVPAEVQEEIAVEEVGSSTEPDLLEKKEYTPEEAEKPDHKVEEKGLLQHISNWVDDGLEYIKSWF